MMRLLSLAIATVFSTAAYPAGNIWLTQISIENVSENNLKIATAETSEPTPTTNAFGYKMYMYEDDSGMAILPTAGVFYDVASGADTECAEVEFKSGMTLYLEVNTENFYKGCHLRTIINSVIPYDGDRDSPPSVLNGSGSLLGGNMIFNAVLSADHAVNPFRHLYHPDHGVGREISRTLTFTNMKQIKGQNNTYSADIAEEVSGLQRVPIKSSGQATFTRIHENVELGLGVTQ